MVGLHSAPSILILFSLSLSLSLSVFLVFWYELVGCVEAKWSEVEAAEIIPRNQVGVLDRVGDRRGFVQDDEAAAATTRAKCNKARGEWLERSW